MRILLVISSLMLCAACASGVTPDGGVASYDALKTARDACLAKGGDLQLAKEGDPQSITAYVCKRK
ncbi:MAG: hypothetical protein H7236_11840 [Gemmatimonadaceae bacterium]|jgi:hypothetical protein|uniref:Lipoprotein n=1 Tax=Phenylobacterium glaciei TaxID=2803784 RepID=A0A941D2T1_9CAUL|nr:hypothetical protein [Phenylobacterium glaciei]MBC7669112.1 hypothetical protein [Caulobacter sp.]MBR7619856.1 hypothetical protein [Phenylobacterium glaciei]QQZ48827.1 hypothetical protein JKL49_15830 [Phenylobacterium glaciei]